MFLNVLLIRKTHFLCTLTAHDVFLQKTILNRLSTVSSTTAVSLNEPKWKTVWFLNVKMLTLSNFLCYCHLAPDTFLHSVSTFWTETHRTEFLYTNCVYSQVKHLWIDIHPTCDQHYYHIVMYFWVKICFDQTATTKVGPCLFIDQEAHPRRRRCVDMERTAPAVRARSRSGTRWGPSRWAWPGWSWCWA